MAMNNKQRWMGGVVLLGGGALLAALLLKGQGEQALTVPPQPTQPTISNSQPSQQAHTADRLQPLTIDVETERQLLEKQRAQREKMVAEQEAKTAEYLAMQQKAEADAARRAAEEYAAQLAKRQSRLDAQAMSSDSLPPELIDDNAQQKNAAQRAEIERLAAQANVRADAAQKASATAEQAAIAARERAEKARAEKEALQKAQAERIEKERLQLEAKHKAEREAKKKEAELAAKQKAEDDAKRKKEQEQLAKRKAEEEIKLKKEQELAAKRKAEDEAKQKKEDELAAKRKAEEEKKKQDKEAKEKLENDKQEREKQAAARKAANSAGSDLQLANKKLEEERGRAILEGDNKPWMVQVSIASNQANADAVVAKLRAKGYKVKTSQTSKGVRVMVGPEKGRSAADALRNQVAKDDSLNAKNAWVIDWQPPE